MTVMKRFQQECSFLNAIRHPNIIQYLGSYQDPDTQLPVLLMELMDDSLTRFLERSQEPLPYHTQVDLCHDISLALAYLHSNGIIHRDLSSNNVLLVGAGNKAKITDFGMAKLFDVNRATMTPLTMCPGTLAYMSPEALDDPPVYTKKLDMFSFGVLDIQIITRQFPEPGPSMKRIHDPQFPIGEIKIPISETERRKPHIDLIDPTHPLLPIAIYCLSYHEEDRPSAQDLCHRLAALKEAPQYSDSVQQAGERSRPAEGTTGDGEDKERHIKKLQQEKDEYVVQIRDLQQQLQISNGQIQELQEATREKDHVIERQLRELKQQIAASENSCRERPIREQHEEFDKQVQGLQQLHINKSPTQAKDVVMAAQREEIQQLKQELEQATRVVETMRKQNQEVTQKLEANEAITAQFQQNLLQEEKLNQELRLELQEKDKPLQQTRKLTFSWSMCNAPCKMKRGSATVCGSMAFFNPDGSNQIHFYNEDTHKWFILQQCPKTDFTLAVINGFVTAVGGIRPGTWSSVAQLTNTLLSVIKEGEKWKWVELFPPMPTKRKLTAVACSGKTLVVAGGEPMSTTGEGVNQSAVLKTVEVMNTDTRQWSRASSLPYPLHNASATICEDRVYVEGRNRLAVFTCSLSALLWSQPSQPVWCLISDLPMEYSTIVTLNGQLLAIGGKYRHGTYTNAIYSHNPVTNFWELITCLPTARYNCLAAVLPGNKLMVVGGETNTGLIDIAEIANIE